MKGAVPITLAIALSCAGASASGLAATLFTIGAALAPILWVLRDRDLAARHAARRLGSSGDLEFPALESSRVHAWHPIPPPSRPGLVVH